MDSFTHDTNTFTGNLLGFELDEQAYASYFYDPNLFQGSMLYGDRDFLEYQVFGQRIWRLGEDMYYPLAPEDPDYSGLLFTGDSEPWYGDLASMDSDS